MTNIERLKRVINTSDAGLYIFWPGTWQEFLQAVGNTMMFEDVHYVDCIETGGDGECDHVHCHKGTESKGWDPETDACNACRECDYFLHEYWNCQGELEPCWEFRRRILNEIVVTKEK